MNRRLHAGAIRLDWRDVDADQVTPQQLDTLFHGLALDLHLDYIDTDDTSISEALSALIMAAFARAEDDIDVTISQPIRADSHPLPPPALWPPPASSLPEIEEETERTIIRPLPVRLKKLLGDSTQALAEAMEQHTPGSHHPSLHFVPVYEIPCNSPSTNIPTGVNARLDMVELSQADAAQLPTLLRPLTTIYTTWAEIELSDLQPNVSQPASIQNYHKTLKRIQDCIALLSSDAHARRAFNFMNRTMWLQRIHTLWIQEKRSYKPRTLPDINRQISSHSWQPFQLAFILLNIPSLIDANYIERNATKGALADLRWFPTGGWLADAYLGLIAYTLGLHRLQSLGAGREDEHAVSAILRSTSYQLTPQRFQHAAALMCACETVRRVDSLPWGVVPFRLGLQSGTPQRISGEALPASNPASKRGAHSGGLLTHCPWCGSDLQVSRAGGTNQGRTLLYCRDPKNECIFCRVKSPEEGLPVLLDEWEGREHLRPALLLTEES